MCWKIHELEYYCSEEQTCFTCGKSPFNTEMNVLVKIWLIYVWWVLCLSCGSVTFCLAWHETSDRVQSRCSADGTLRAAALPLAAQSPSSLQMPLLVSGRCWEGEGLKREIVLLTCHETLYSSMGHTTIAGTGRSFWGTGTARCFEYQILWWQVL